MDILANNFESEEADVKIMQISETFLRKNRKHRKNCFERQKDPKALKCVDELLKRYKENSPKVLDSYDFKSYSKISIDFDKDSIVAYQDFMAKRTDSIKKIENRTLKKQSDKK